MRPTYRIIANGADLAGVIAGKLKSLVVTDEAGFEADTMELVLADTDQANPIAIPPTGALLEIWMGYDTRLQRMGTFTADEVEVSGPPGQLAIRGRAAPYESGQGGLTDIQTQKTRSWEAETKLADMVATIAQEHGLQPAVSPSLQSVTLPQYDQTGESDISFLVRVARKYDAIVKPAGGKLMVAKLGESRTATGEPLPMVTLAAQACSRWSLSITTRDSEGSVVAYYYDLGEAERKSATAGSGDPVRELRHDFPDQATAEAAVQAELAKRMRRKNKFSAGLPGNAGLMAESQVQLVGYREGIPTTWLVSRVQHRLDTADGFTTELECELPTDGDAETDGGLDDGEE